jgi:2-amino-4-hydroxy-6-hydroxymethyldihydropteridine diphosphokinase
VAEHTTWIGLGTNLGDRSANLAAAAAGLCDLMSVDAVASVYESAPFGYVDQPDFLNTVVRGRTDLAPRPLLDALKQLERALGRVATFRMGPRHIDLDLLLYDDVILDQAGLTIPHPGIGERPFVWVPLLELDPELRDPRSGVALAATLSRTTPAGLRRVADGAALLRAAGAALTDNSGDCAARG